MENIQQIRKSLAFPFLPLYRKLPMRGLHLAETWKYWHRQGCNEEVVGFRREGRMLGRAVRVKSSALIEVQAMKAWLDGPSVVGMSLMIESAPTSSFGHGEHSPNGLHVKSPALWATYSGFLAGALFSRGFSLTRRERLA